MNFNTRIIDNPSALPAAEKARLMDQFIHVCAKASSFGVNEQESITNWTHVWHAIADLGIYAKIVCVEDEQRNVIGFATAKHLEINGKPVFMGQLSYTLPEYQGQKLTGNALQQLLGPEDIPKFIGGYIVAATPNPAVYEGVNKMTGALAQHYNLNSTVYPQIDASGQALTIPAHIVAVAERAITVMDAEASLDRENFILGNLFQHHGKVYSSYNFKCKTEHVRKFFEENISPERHDVVMMVVSLEEKQTLQAAA
ncbi:hypothetical protein [Oceanicoccus sp. KOV_DT_Chl]|uniref:hypothetical protein n=1 Tax=Oceanicoccus sp. KOV_DT_Chl TaxID=1904639 RepID=UPI000C7E742D|nr:hypothetical protein [Oceanicoccus sp. KOV_DT_Chl]